ncbi:hypothetical protein [Erythrobacter phage vB_EliS-L02]|nr:hypothetical protein [Erythrobacter phage vB_EliS-L02]
MGMLHARSGPLDEETRDELIQMDRDLVVYMDYVHGRQCKFQIRKHEGRFYTFCEWYDHSYDHLLALLEKIEIGDAQTKLDGAIEALNKSRAEATA